MGIHANVDKSGSSSNPTRHVSSTDGHAWISIRSFPTGITSTYGLYPDEHPSLEKHGYDRLKNKSDIRKNYEIALKRSARHSRYYGLTQKQHWLFLCLVQKNVRHKTFENCASWVAQTARRVTLEEVTADERILRFIETPRKLARYISTVEAIRKTTRQDPLPPLSLNEKLTSEVDD